MFDLNSPIFLAWVQRLWLTSHMLDVLAQSYFEQAQKSHVWVHRCNPELRSSDISAWVTSDDWYCSSLRHHCGPRGSAVYHAHKAGSLTSPVPSQFSTISHPCSHFTYANWKATPTPFPLEFAGSLAQHGYEIIERKKKWTVLKRESQQEKDRTQCAVIVMNAKQHPPSTPPTSGDKSASYPTLYPPAACLLQFRVMRWQWCHWL